MTRDTALALEDGVIGEVSFASPKTISDCFALLRRQALRLRIRPNERFAIEGRSAEYIFRIITGCVRHCRHLDDGRRPISDFLFAGDLIGLGPATTYALTAEAVSPVFLMAYPRRDFDRLAQEHDRIRMDMMDHLVVALERAQQQVFLLNTQSARERVSSFLLRLSEQGQSMEGGRLALPMGRQDIADHLGLSVETICRALTQLRQAGLITILNPQLIVIPNPAALRSGAESIALSH